MRVYALALSSVVLAGFTAIAQQPQSPQPKFDRIPPGVAPVHAGTYHPSTGLTPTYSNARIGNRWILNSTLTNYYGIPGTDQEWIDDVFLHDEATDHTDQVNGFEFIYCSADTNPNGTAVTMNFYEESIYCGGPVNWPVSDCSYNIVGLPGGNNGALACWTVLVDLWGVECDLATTSFGQMRTGWGQVWNNNTTGPWTATAGAASTDYWTWFDTTLPNINAFQGCYWNGGLPEKSFYLDMFGGPIDTNRYWADDLGGTSTPFDNGLLDVDNQVKVGNTVTFQLTDPNSVGYDGMQLFHARAPSSWAIPYMGGNVLIEPATMSAMPIGPTSQTYTIPAVMGDRYTQAACFQNGQLVGFSNALRHQAL